MISSVYTVCSETYFHTFFEWKDLNALGKFYATQAKIRIIILVNRTKLHCEEPRIENTTVSVAAERFQLINRAWARRTGSPTVQFWYEIKHLVFIKDFL